MVDRVSVTERLVTDPAEALHASQLRDLLSRLPIGVIGVDAELAVEYVNPAGLSYLRGVSVGALLPEPWPAFSLHKFAQRLFDPWPPVRQVAEAADGRLIELDGIPAGESDTALLILQDVTLRERQRRAEREFVANAAHELRTPIAAIGSALEVLQSGAKDEPGDRDLFLGHIERESRRLGRLLRALLLLARVQTGQEIPELGLVHVAPLLTEIAGQIEAKDGVLVRVDCAPGVAMLADADLLQQAVLNLAVNAVVHTSEGEIVLAGRNLGHVSEIEVRDTGSGISVAEQGRVFDRFFRVQQHSGGGFGLGLPISQEIARALGGTVTLDGEAGLGTCVRMRIPSARLVRA